MKRFYVVGSLLVLLTLLLAACSSAGDENNEGTPGTDLTPMVTSVVPGIGATEPVATLPAATEVVPMPTETSAAAATPNVATPGVGVTGTVTTTTGMDMKNSPMLASNWFGRDIENANGDNVGEIKGFVVDEANGNIQYAILGAGGFLGIGEKLVIVPFSAFKVDLQATDDNQMVTLNADQTALASAPNFDQLPDMAVTDWDKDIRAYWSDKVENLPATGPTANTHWVRVDSMDSFHIVNVACDDFGNVDNLVIDTKTGQIMYALVEVDWDALAGVEAGAQATTPAGTPVATPVSPSTSVKPEGNLLLVPWGAFVGHNKVGQMGAGQDQSGGGQSQMSACPANEGDINLVLDTGKLDLKAAPVLKSQDELPDFTMPDWDKELHTFWDNVTS
jgi:sporulation protein YlmC with PRC-barrel domain